MGRGDGEESADLDVQRLGEYQLKLALGEYAEENDTGWGSGMISEIVEVARQSDPDSLEEELNLYMRENALHYEPRLVSDVVYLIQQESASRSTSDTESVERVSLEVAKSDPNFIRLGEVAHACHEQTQYFSRYVTGIADTQLGDDLRISETPIDGDYHQIRIHRDDAPILARRVAQYKVEMGNRSESYLASVEDGLRNSGLFSV